MKARLAALTAAFAWVLVCVRWFDVAAPARPAWLGAVPPALPALILLAALVVLLRRHGPELLQLPSGASWRDAAFVAGLAVVFRLPMVWTAAVGYTTPDGALSGIVASRLRHGLERLVFVPSVPYSGSLKSHLAAGLGVLELPRAFTLSSVLFFAAAVAVVYALAAMPGALSGSADAGRRAALYLAFAPAFVTRYSLSNDGNYVEVLALGTAALYWAIRSREATPPARLVLAWAAGLALGLAFWCHILAAIHWAAVVLVFVLGSPRSARRTVPRLALGGALGYFPGLLWNLAHGGDSFRYLLPGGERVGTLGAQPSLAAHIALILRDHLPVLVGYDPGYGGATNAALVGLAALALAAVAAAFVGAARRLHATRDFATGALLLFAVINVAVALLALPHIPGNPRYLLFLTAPIAVFLAHSLRPGWPSGVLALLLAGGVVGSLGQWPAAARSDERWRAFVRDLGAAGVTHCYTDFYIAAKIDFVSDEQVVCASDLGPTTTEYFHDYPQRVAAAERPALIAVNPTMADKLERRLRRIGVSYQRYEMMKPVIVPARHVRPADLFPASPE